MGIRSINSQGNGCSRLRVGQNRYRGKEQLGAAKGGVKDDGLRERFTRTLEGVGERSRTNAALR